MNISGNLDMASIIGSHDINQDIINLVKTIAKSHKKNRGKHIDNHLNNIVIEDITNDHSDTNHNISDNTSDNISDNNDNITIEFMVDPEVVNKVVNKVVDKVNIVSRVGIVDDVRCEFHVQFSEHQESPDRITAIREKLKITGLYDKLIHIQPIDISDKDLRLVHTNKYVNKVVRTCTNYSKAMIDCDDVRVNGKDSLISAGVAAGGVIAAVNAVLAIAEIAETNITETNITETNITETNITETKITKIFCNVRPPGHHASQNRAAGFCIFNNVAIGAQYALKQPNINRVLIVDWDLHHGDGTQKIFKCSRDVMYTSFHREAPFYPGSGSFMFKGKHGNIHNYPQNEYVTVDEYMTDFYNMMAKAEAFRPDLIFISAGFDSHKDDLYHALPLDYEHFSIMTKEICVFANKICGGRVISVLEGGYTTDVLGECVKVHIEAMLNNN